MQLQKYDFKVKFKPGKSMYVSDFFSIMNLPETEECIPDIDINQLQLNAHLRSIMNLNRWWRNAVFKILYREWVAW